MRYNHVTISGTLLMAAALLLPARAANIDDLAETYSGRVHHSSIPSEEDESVTFFIIGTQPNGKFTGNIGGGIPISGKVTASGAVTFSGSAEDKGGSIQIKKGTGQLSATGRFIVGSFQLKGAGANTPGKYTFHVDAAS
jgi:hypothetical protein